ncbi:MAG: replicative DNA helicase [Candidatus Parcubacteria bacterium]|jgi:replicative DNA helicase|nr:MAG: replicative DNA helicase [Candidatus Parcubacteria bacterium]
MSLNKENQILERIPPHSLEAEESLLGCLLIDKDAIIKVADTVLPQDFYKEAHQTIFEVIKELYGNQESIDIITVSNRLEEKKKLTAIGGRSTLARLSNSVATSANVSNYADIIQRKATLRRLQQASSEIMTLSYDEERDIDDVLDETEKKIFAVSRKYLKNAFLPIDSLLSEAFERIDDLHKRSGSGLRGLATGFSDLDNLLAGLQKSDLIILAARPSVGKTSLALDVARQAAIKNKVGVGIFSLEMSKDQLVDRMLCSQAGVNLWKMRTGNLSDSGENNDFEKIADAMGKLAEAQIYIDDSGSLSIMEIRAKCRRLQMEKGLGLIIIDYLQLMEGNGRYGDNRVQEIAEISRGLKSIARELNIPVLALAQLSRAVEATSPAIPKLSHLRDSGSIEQDADIVMFIYRKAADRNYNLADLPADERYKAEIHVAKHRNGPVGKIDLYFEEATASFHNLSHAPEQQ